MRQFSSVQVSDVCHPVYSVSMARSLSLAWRRRRRVDFGEVYRARNVVYAMRFPGGLNITAPWGQS